MSQITFAEASQLLAYDPHSGRLTWLVTPGRRTRAGNEAGNIDSHTGYRRVMVRRRNLQAHRLAWLLMTEHWPAREIDHIDGDKLNNRWANLRDVDSQTNSQNERGPRKNNKTGVMGVRRRDSGRYFAAIGVDSRKQYLGSFDTAEEAADAYLIAKRRLHKGCTL